MSEHSMVFAQSQAIFIFIMIMIIFLVSNTTIMKDFTMTTLIIKFISCFEYYVYTEEK